jgi:hypothetical protein
MDAPALTYRQTGSRWLTDLKSTYTVQLIMQSSIPNIKSFCPVEAVKIFNSHKFNKTIAQVPI